MVSWQPINSIVSICYWRLRTFTLFLLVRQVWVKLFTFWCWRTTSSLKSVTLNKPNLRLWIAIRWMFVETMKFTWMNHVFVDVRMPADVTTSDTRRIKIKSSSLTPTEWRIFYITAVVGEDMSKKVLNYSIYQDMDNGAYKAESEGSLYASYSLNSHGNLLFLGGSLNTWSVLRRSRLLYFSSSRSLQ